MWNWDASPQRSYMTGSYGSLQTKLLKGPLLGTVKFREVQFTSLPDAGLIPGCGMLSSPRLSTQHILLFSQYRNTISLCHFTHVKAVSTSEYSISTYQLSGFLIERLEMGLNVWEEIINHRYMLFPEFQSVYDFRHREKWALCAILGATIHHLFTRHIFLLQLRNCTG